MRSNEGRSKGRPFCAGARFGLVREQEVGITPIECARDGDTEIDLVPLVGGGNKGVDDLVEVVGGRIAIRNGEKPAIQDFSPCYRSERPLR